MNIRFELFFFFFFCGGGVRVYINSIVVYLGYGGEDCISELLASILRAKEWS